MITCTHDYVGGKMGNLVCFETDIPCGNENHCCCWGVMSVAGLDGKFYKYKERCCLCKASYYPIYKEYISEREYVNFGRNMRPL